MASAIIMMLGSAIVSAFAFAGTNYLFSHIDGNSNDEKKRHDDAMEKLATEKKEWEQERLKRSDFLKEQEKKEQQGVEEYAVVEEAMEDYYSFTTENPEPKLSDFYTPSEDQMKREIVFVVGGMAVTGLIAWKLTN